MDYDPQAIEPHWRERWAEAGIYEAEPDRAPEDGTETTTDEAEKTFITVPYPYPNGGMHIGHARTYTVPDVYARYRRLQGDSVLFPLAWHITGTPIIGAVERLNSGEEDQLSILRDTYDVPEDTLQDLETPMGFARYFIEEHYKENMRALGLSIDWRREFTTNDERYSKFVSWQYETLHDRDLLEKGYQPVNYCTNEEQPVTAHDLLEGEDAEFQDYTLIEFGWEDAGSGGETASEGVVVPMATLRPETVRGVTNAYIDPGADYVLADVDSERWLVSRAAAEKLKLQQREVDVLEEFTGKRLVGERVENPVTGENVLVLPARFVDADNATGVVMSVPAHSPDDWIALQEAKADAEHMEEFGIDPAEVREIEPRAIIDVEGFGEFPAQDAIEQRGIESSDDPRLEEATQDVYNREFHAGALSDAYGQYAGEVVADVRDDLRTTYREQGAFDAMHEFTEEVICRCGGSVEVSIQETWFLRYNDAEWRTRAKEAISGMEAIPENTREQYYHTVDWLEEWPCIRNYGLGTKLPWDPDFIIEPLSDSTIYMAYYTIAHRLDDIPPEDLDHDFFDALFYGAEAVENPDERALALGEEWDFWYPVDFRCSATDLIPNHLTFFLYHHAELFEQSHWPQGITGMGMGLLEGSAMSSSKGHVVLPSDAIAEYGADTVRFFLLNSSEPWQDFDWRSERVGDTRRQLERFWNRAAELIDEVEANAATDTEADDDGDTNASDAEVEIDGEIDNESEDGRSGLDHTDRWLLSKLGETIEEATEAMERFETRAASQAIFFRFEDHLRWYRRRADLDRPAARWTLQEVLETRLRLLAPFVPFLANELHERLTGTPAEEARWPDPESTPRNERIELEERLVSRLTDDVRDIVEVTGTDPEVVRVYVAAEWKRAVFEQVLEAGPDPDVGGVMSEVMADPELRERGDAVNELANSLIEVVRGQEADREATTDIDERATYERAGGFLEREFDAEIEIYPEEEAVDPADRASSAEPLRPAIHIE
ncbi:leucine--tRNA ligase [Halobacteriales archaeon QH_8_64_26]|nr:MAG: leucine--tRNA ligase [Halobacteriales archaeon QH_8_64_26]